MAPSKQEPLQADSPKPPTFSTKLGACVQYAIVSTCLTLFNRAVFTVYQFNYPNVVTLLQLLVSICYLFLFNAFGWITLGKFSWAQARKIAPLALFWWLYVVSGVAALRYLNVPMYSAFRRSTTLFVVVGEYLTFNTLPSTQKLVCLAFMVGGATVAGLNDLTFSLPGYIWVFICAVSTALYLILIKFLKNDTGLNQHALLLYNNFLALPLMAAFLIFGTNELSEVGNYPDLYKTNFQLFLLLSVSQAFLLNMCIFRCTLINSPLATTVTGQVKDIATTGLGMFLFNDVAYHLWNTIGIVCGLAGSIAYSLLSYLDRAKP